MGSVSTYKQDGTITTGGTAQNVFTQPNDTTKTLVPTNGFEISNPDASETLWINEGGTALANGAGSKPILAGGTYTTPVHGNYSPCGLISIVGATTGHKYTARFW